MHQPIPLANLPQHSQSNAQLHDHGFCAAQCSDGDSDHKHDNHDLFGLHIKRFTTENRSSSSQISYGRNLQSTPSNEDVSTESSRGSTDREDLEALAARGAAASPHHSAEECQCPLPLVAEMETDKLLRESTGTQHHNHHAHHSHHSLSMAYSHSSSARCTHILSSGPIPPINDVVSGQMEFELAFTGIEMGVHIAGTVVVSALIALSVWLTVANVTL